MDYQQGGPRQMTETDRQEIRGEKTQQLTPGQQLVGLTFNPSGDPKVVKAKQLCADLYDLICEDKNSAEHGALYHALFEHSRGEILNAQMNVVKLLTLKY